MGKVFMAESQQGSFNALSTGFRNGHGFLLGEDFGSDGNADWLILDSSYYVINFPGAQFQSTQFDHLYGNLGGLNPHENGGYGNYEVRIKGEPSSSSASNAGARWALGVLELKDNGKTCFPGGFGYTVPAYSYGTYLFDNGPRQGVRFFAYCNPIHDGYDDDGMRTAILSLAVTAQGWQYDASTNPIDGSKPGFKQYTATVVLDRTCILNREWASPDPGDNLLNVEYQLRTVVTADGFQMYALREDGTYLDLMAAMSPTDAALIQGIFDDYRVPGAVPIGHAMRLGFNNLRAGYEPWIKIMPDPPEPIGCCPPLPQRLDLGCGDGGCGRDFRLVQIGWSDTLKGEDGEYTFPETRLNPVETVKLTVPVGRQTKDYRLTMGSVLWAPLTIAAVEWTGQYFNNTRRVG